MTKSPQHCKELQSVLRLITHRLGRNDVITAILKSIIFTFVFTLSIAMTSHAATAPGADIYGHTPAYEGVRISHDARRIAFIQTRDSQHVVFIFDFDNDTICGYAMAKLKVRELIWAPQDRLLIRVSPSRADLSRYLSINVNCADPRLLFDQPLSSVSRLIGWAPDGKRLLWTSLRHISGGVGPRRPDTLGWDRRRSRIIYALDVIAVDPATGATETVEKGSGETIDWLADADGKLRIRVDENKDEVISVFVRWDEDKDWQPVFSTRNSSAGRKEAATFVAMGPKPDTAYVLTRNGGDKRSALEFNLRNKAFGNTLFKHPDFDVTGYQLDEFTGLAIGVEYTDDILKVDYIDPTVSDAVARIRSLFPKAQVNVQSASGDRNHFILRVDSPDHPTGTYFHADVSAGKVSQLGSRFPAITKAHIAPVKSFTYAARDGMRIPAYLTLPPGAGPGKLPLVVMPHGGPESRDSANFDPWAQFIATRGYAVFQPQFRGSDGFGLAFRQAGRHQWGLKMQDDITDGVRKLVAEGTVDPSRICIFGWSYGGYAAMAGLTFTPELYKCGISGAGVSDLPDMFGHLKRKSFGGWDHAEYWRAVIGDTFADAPRLMETSPINSVKSIRAPLLLLHGKYDTVVPITQSEGMAKALKKAGKPFEYIELEDDDHWLSYADSEKRALKEIERFLKLHLQ